MTVEAAVASAALVAFFSAMVGALAYLAAYLAAVDTAGAAARAHAVGIELVEQRERVTVAEEGGVITVTATVGPATARAVFPVEFR